MAFQTLYRKYRPRTFSQVAGQHPVKELFQAVISRDQVAHAYIFSGPRGTGKTTVARILAKRLNCLDPKGSEPCNACEQCLAIDASAHLDVVEMDAASNRGIDDFRAIREKVSYRPSQGKYKVYIIDEVHMLTTEAFNAILKTLEEPPPHVVFVLATTNPEKIPETILSRCQIIPFRSLSESDIRSFLQGVAQQEGFAISPPALGFIARYARGGMRDALVLLEQAYQVSQGEGESVGLEQLNALTGGIEVQVVEEFLDAALGGDSQTVVRLVERLHSEGKSFENFLSQGLDCLVQRMAGTQAFAQNVVLAHRLAELANVLRYASNKKSLLIVEMLYFMQQHAPGVSAPPKPENPLPKSEERVVPAPVAEKEPGNLEPLLAMLQQQRFALYVALKCLSTVPGENKYARLLLAENREYLLSTALQAGVQVEEYLPAPGVEAVSGRRKVHGISDVPSEFHEQYKKVLSLFPDDDVEIFIEDDTE
ncbi:MAG TPA: DNA polymerase III subunit gamma/tau [Thermotogota bacterium]|nr:DNA polymerase III subunit gamma/tau [Thermotogota bacterium]